MSNEDAPTEQSLDLNQVVLFTCQAIADALTVEAVKVRAAAEDWTADKVADLLTEISAHTLVLSTQRFGGHG